MYEKVDSVKAIAAAEVRYLLVMSLEKLEAESEDNKAFPSFIPVTWFSSDKTRFLYPPKNSEKDKSGPVDWANRVFARHYYPKSSWEEHDVKEIIIDKPSKYF